MAKPSQPKAVNKVTSKVPTTKRLYPSLQQLKKLWPNQQLQKNVLSQLQLKKLRPNQQLQKRQLLSQLQLKKLRPNQQLQKGSFKPTATKAVAKSTTTKAAPKPTAPKKLWPNQQLQKGST